jgi:molybdate transport system substrate-binding protein
MENKYILISKVSLLFLCGVLSLVGVVGCGKKDAEDKQKELVVLCGNSFVNPIEQLCKEFTEQTGVKVSPSVGGSEDLLPLVKVGRQGDIFVTHDPYLDYVADAEALADHVQVGFVAPVLAVQKGNPKGITCIDDLTRGGLKVALTNPEFSTCGEMVFRLLDKKGIKDLVMKNVGNRLTRRHSDLGTLLKIKTVDAVIMWNGVAHTFRDSLEVVPTPYEYETEIRVHIIGLNYSSKPELLKKFIELARDRGPAVFAEHGYVKEAEVK